MKLHPYQERGVERIEAHKRVYVAFDMGMGKTLTSLAAGDRLTDRNVLVIAEKNEIVNSQNFRKEVDAYFPELGYFSLRDVPISALPEGRHVCGVNPDALVKLEEKLIQRTFGFAIVDEATIAKTTTTARFKRILKICNAMPYVVLLSGTPMMNGASEIFAPLVILGHWLGGDGTRRSKEAFERIFAGGFFKQVRFTGPFWQQYKWWAKGANNLRELRWMTRNAFLFERKEDTGIFKKKVRETHAVPMSKAWREEYDAAWDDYIAKVQEHNKRADPDKIKSIHNIKELQHVIENGQVLQVNSKWKARAIVRDLKAGMYDGHRVIVWSMFIETDRILQEELEKAGISFRTFEEVKEWKRGTEQVLVGKILSHGKGGNVPEASVALFADMHYVPTNNIQAENRIDRPEQTRDMLVRYYMTEEETVDQHVQKINRDKMRKIEAFTAPFTPEEEREMPERCRKLMAKYRKDFAVLARGAGVVYSEGLCD